MDAINTNGSRIIAAKVHRIDLHIADKYLNIVILTLSFEYVH